MTWQNPWVISGVSEVPLEVARVLAYVATGGSEGVVSPYDLEVKATTTPSAQVTIGSGAFACLNRFVGQSNQSYIGYNVGIDTVTISANNTASARSDLLYAHITDPGMSGQPATALPVQTRIIQGVGSTITRLQDVPGFAAQSGYAIARIDVTANTATITQSMIVDLRQLLFSKRQTEVKMSNRATGSTAVAAPATFGTVFPPGVTWSIAIPSWATRMALIGNLNQLEIRGTEGQSANGSMRINIGAGAKTTSASDFNLSVTSGSKDVFTLMNAGDMTVPVAMQGTTQTFMFEVRKTAGTATVYAVEGTTSILQVIFYSTATSSLSTG